MFLGFPVVLMSPLAFLSRPSALAARDPPPPRHDLRRAEFLLRAVPPKDRRTTRWRASTCRRWRFAFNGAEPVSPDTIVSFRRNVLARWGFRKNAVSPCYGLAECSVGVAFTTPGEPWRMDTLDRETFSTTGEAVDAGPQDPAPLKIVGCGQVIADHDLRVVDGAGLELPDRQEGLLQFRGPSATTGYYRNPEATKALFDGDWVNTGDRAYLVRRHGLHHRPREGHHHPRRPQHQPLRAGGGGRRPARHPARLRRGVRQPWTARAAPSAWWCSPRRASTDADAHEALKKQINELAVSLIARAGRRHRARAAGAPCRRPPAARSAASRRASTTSAARTSVRPQAVWLQFARLALAGVAPQLRRGWRAVQRHALRGARRGRHRAVVPGRIPRRGVSCRARRAWRVAGALRAALLPPVRHPAGGARPGEPAARARACSPPTTPATSTALVLMAALAARAFAFVAKRELLGNLVTRMLRSSGIGSRVRRALRRAEERRARRRAGRRRRSAAPRSIVFPEGTFQRRPGLMAFRAGAFQAAAQAGVPVVPVALRGVRSVLRDGTWYLRRSPVAVSFAPPVQPEGADWNAVVKLRDQRARRDPPALRRARPGFLDGDACLRRRSPRGRRCGCSSRPTRTETRPSRPICMPCRAT